MERQDINQPTKGLKMKIKSILALALAATISAPVIASTITQTNDPMTDVVTHWANGVADNDSSFTMYCNEGERIQAQVKMDKYIGSGRTTSVTIRVDGGEAITRRDQYVDGKYVWLERDLLPSSAKTLIVRAHGYGLDTKSYTFSDYDEVIATMTKLCK